MDDLFKVSDLSIKNTNDTFEISIESQIGFRTKAELYDFYKTIYDSFVKDYTKNFKTKNTNNINSNIAKDQHVIIIFDKGYYKILERLNFVGHVTNCKVWFKSLMDDIHNLCFDN